MDDERALTHKEQYDAVVRQIEREEGLINNRLSWMLAFQGFLFAARGFATDAGSDGATDVFEHVLAVLGMVVAFLGLLGAAGAYWAMGDTSRFYERRLSDEPSFMRPYGCPGAARLGKAPALGIPIATISAWGWLLTFG